MATKKRAQLVAGLLEGRSAAPSATLHVLPIEPRKRSAEAEAVEAEAEAAATPVSEPSPQRAAIKGAKPCGDLSAMPISPRQATSSAAEAVFHQKGSANATSFRPWYWQY